MEERSERWSDSSDSSVFSSFSWWRLKSFAGSAADPFRCILTFEFKPGPTTCMIKHNKRCFFSSKIRKKQLKDKILRENISDAGAQDVRSSGNLKRRRKLWASGVAGGFLPN